MDMNHIQRHEVECILEILINLVEHKVLGQMPKSSSKVLFKLGFFFHGNLYCCARYSNINNKTRYSKLIIKSDAQKVMARYGFGSRFYDIKYFVVEFKFIVLEFIMNLRVAPQLFFL